MNLSLLQNEGISWREVKDGNDDARALFDRHYSRHRYSDGRKPKLFVGPGEKMVLMTLCGLVLFVWRKFISGDGQEGLNCAIFRNESQLRSSDLIVSACEMARERWGNIRFYTYVNPRRVRSANPGCCFLKAGWRKCVVTKRNKLLILELLPS